MQIIDTFGMKLRVREYREAREMSQLDLALAAGLNQSQISRIERAARGIRLDHLEAVATVFEVPVTELIIEKDDESDYLAFYRFFGAMPREARENMVKFAMSLPNASAR